ncbi:hypothetical protein BC835DRAFT_452553 [Cytidiella melzeri]|nr:hypothetical protein BC835DRAFT_452553 [Cytidiella melzeri]
MCEWEDCGRRFPTQEMLATHLYRHSENFMICAYDALMPNELVFHHKGHDGQPLKPTAVSLFKRTCPSPPPLPQVLPAYMTVPLRVAPAPISRDLHVWIGSKIAANITCYIHPGSRANAAAPSRATRRLAEKVALVEREAQKAGKDPTQAILHMSHGEYDSWIPYHSQRGPKYCDDLPASEVTAMVASGLVIGPEYLAGDRPWPPKGAANIDGEDGIDELDSPFEDIVNESDKTVVVEDAETSHDATARTNEAIKVDEVAVVTGTEMQIEPALSTIHSQVSSQSLGLPAPVPASDGEQQESDRGHDERAAESETLSQTGWALLREDSADVNDML